MDAIPVKIEEIEETSSLYNSMGRLTRTCILISPIFLCYKSAITLS